MPTFSPGSRAMSAAPGARGACSCNSPSGSPRSAAPRARAISLDLYVRPDHAYSGPYLVAGPSMDLQELISRLGVALGIGLLIGLERGWRRRGATPGSRAAGIRTFALSGLLGGVIAALAKALPKQESGGA